MAAPDSIKKLVEEFERLKGGPPPDFDETQLCTSYVEPFWEALGWKVRDPREVVKEKRVHLRASTKHADYCFQLKGKPQFVLEAKDYRKRLDDPDFIFQTKRYGYNLPVDFGVLTNFAEFRLYDTGLQPLYENAARGLFKPYLLQYAEYEAKWDELAAVFSREAVGAGALRALLPKARRERNKEALDRKFFERLNEWRTEFARVIALRNPDVGVHEINEAVQRILDRAIFMRVIEDREIEATELLLGALNKWGHEKEKPLYRYLVDKFRYLEPQYNGELFEPHFSEDLIVDDKPLKDFVESLYYPQCPYQFNVVGVEMLGTIYERFLGSTIRLI
jgi:adenine-specific DNA-methyltransferase